MVKKLDLEEILCFLCTLSNQIMQKELKDLP